MKYETNFTGTVFFILSEQCIRTSDSLAGNDAAGASAVLTTPAGKQETWKLIRKEEWAKDVFNKLKERTEVIYKPDG